MAKSQERAWDNSFSDPGAPWQDGAKHPARPKGSPATFSQTSSSNGILLHMAQESRAGHTKIVGSTIQHIPSGTHTSVLHARRELCVPAAILAQSEHCNFHTLARFHFTSLTSKNLRVKPSQVNFDKPKKPQSNKPQNYLHLSQDNHALPARNCQWSPAWQNIEPHATGSGGCREEEGRF